MTATCSLARSWRSAWGRQGVQAEVQRDVGVGGGHDVPRGPALADVVERGELPDQVRGVGDEEQVEQSLFGELGHCRVVLDAGCRAPRRVVVQPGAGMQPGGALHQQGKLDLRDWHGMSPKAWPTPDRP